MDGRQPVLDRDLWQKVQQQLKDQGTARKGVTGKSALNPLAGKLFDANGNRLIPSHTVKNGRRYRYYLSEKLVSGRGQDSESTWRLSAPQIETAIAAEAQKLLEEPATIATLVKSVSGDRHQARLLIERLKSCADRLKDDDARAAALAELVHKIEIADERIAIELSVTTALDDMTFTHEPDAIRHEVPLRLKRDGVETRLIIGGIERRPTGPDPYRVPRAGGRASRPEKTRSNVLRSARTSPSGICGIFCSWRFWRQIS